jgi:hypothetical protein
MTGSNPPVDPHPDLFSLGQHQPAPVGASVAAVPRGYAPRPVTPDQKKAGPVRRILPYVAVIYGALTVLLTVPEFAFSGNGSYRGGQLLGLLLAIPLVVGGCQEIASHHLRRIRYLPWLMALETAFLALAVVAVLALRGAYPASVRAAFVGSCEARGGASSYCGCVLSWFESHRSLAQFMADANATETEASRSDMAEAVASCTGK